MTVDIAGVSVGAFHIDAFPSVLHNIDDEALAGAAPVFLVLTTLSLISEVTVGATASLHGVTCAVRAVAAAVTEILADATVLHPVTLDTISIEPDGTSLSPRGRVVVESKLGVVVIVEESTLSHLSL